MIHKMILFILQLFLIKFSGKENNYIIIMDVELIDFYYLIMGFVQVIINIIPIHSEYNIKL